MITTIEFNSYYFSFFEDIATSYQGPVKFKISPNTTVGQIKQLLIDKQSPYQIYAKNINEITAQLVFYGSQSGSGSPTCIKLTDNKKEIKDMLPVKLDLYNIHWYLSDIKTFRYQVINVNKKYEVIERLNLVSLSDDMKLDDIKSEISGQIGLVALKILDMNNIEMHPDKTLAQLGITPTTTYPDHDQVYRRLVINSE